jgi:formylmethanofuran dehydrogenase subunit C
MMKDGIIEIHGNAGNYLGAPYRGSTAGMHGGKITVFGNVGHETGACMKKGTIKICGSSGQFTGLRMRNGTIYVQGNCDERAGACMLGGKIVVGGALQSVLPSFSIDSIKPRVKIEENETIQGPFYVFLGDLVEYGKGKLYVSKQKNPQLSSCERFL